MELIDFFNEKKFAGCENIYISPHIPAKLLSNAVGAYSVRVDPKEVVVLIDDTAFGSGKDGILICENRLIIREMFSSARAYEYDAIESISCEGRRLYINGREAYKLNMPGKDELAVFFELMNQWVSRRVATMQNREPSASSPAGSNTNASMGAFLYDVGRKVISDKVFVRPHIPAKKLQSAVNAYGKGVSPDDVIILVDDTGFGSAKDGILITDKSIYIKIFTESLRAFEWQVVESISIEKRTIYINGAASGKLMVAADKDIGQLFEKIDDFLTDNYSSASRQAVGQSSAFQRETSLELNFDMEEVLPQSDQTKNKTENGQELVATNSHIKTADAELATQSNNKLAGYVSTLIADNKSKIIPLLEQKTGDISLAALQDDTNVLRLSGYLYERLPSVVKLAVSEAALNKFMLDNREKLLAKLLFEEQSKQENSVVPAQDIGSSAVQDETQAMVSVVEAEVIASHPDEGFVASASTAAQVSPKDSKAKDKLLGYVATAIEQNKSKIIPILKEKTGEASLAALRDDANVEKLAGFIYAFLPAVVRLALKEEIFTQFMLDNRNKLLDKLVQNDLLPVSSVAQQSIEIPVQTPDDFESQLMDLLGSDEPVEDSGKSVIAILERVVQSLRQEGVDDPDSKLLFDLAVNHLAALLLKARNIQSSSREKVEEQIGFMLSFMYGFSYHKIPESIRGQENIFEAYMSMLFVTLEKYKDFGGADLIEQDSESLTIFAYGMAKVLGKEQLNQMVRKIIDEHKNTAVPGDFSLDDIMSLLREANAAAERWVVQLNEEIVAEEREVQRKWGDLLS